SRSDQKAAARQGQAMGYRFTLGQTFGYRVEIEFEESYKSVRFAGSPIFSVRSVDRQRGVQMLAIAKLSCFSKIRGSSEESVRPTAALWLGSVITMSPSGSVGGKKDYGDKALPDFLTCLVKPKELVFPALTASINGSRYEESGAFVWFTTKS